MVNDCKTQQGVPDVTVKIVGSDGSKAETKTDSIGNYSFSNCFKRTVSYVETIDISTNSGPNKDIGYGTCSPMWQDDYSYLNSSEKHNIRFSDTAQHQRYNFCLEEYYHCLFSFPDFKFKKNSTDFFLAEKWIYTSDIDSALDCFTALMIAKKSWVMEIVGHAASDEKNKQELAFARAKVIAAQLIKRGIDPKRLVCVSVSDKSPYEYKDENGFVVRTATKNSEENCRVFMSVLSKDYVPQNK